MTFQALNTALSGLRIAQQQLNVISNNVSNATTPGYTRKILPQSTQVVNATGEIIGVQAETLIRKVDLNLERELWTQISSVSALDIKATYLDTIEKFHGPTNKELSIAAQIAQLKDKFAALSDSPADSFLLQSALSQADVVADKFNDFGKLITQLRNDAQDEIDTTVDRINDLLSTVADLNKQVKGSYAVNRSVAGIEDKRDEVIKELSSLINITFFTRGDGVLVIQSSTGSQLTDETPTELFFDPEILGTNTTYPGSVAGVYVGGDPSKNKTAVDITSLNVGGKLGGLIDLRDDTLLQYQAQVDELAHKLALRLESQGLRLFTDPTGAVPSDAPPDPSAHPPVAVAYVGFASIIQVNKAVVADVSLLQKGTYDSDITIPAASNEVIRRVIQFGFGDISHQVIAGTADLNIALPATDLQDWLGLHSTNKVVGGIDLTSFPQIDDGATGGGDLVEQLQEFFPNYPANDQFQITFSEPRLALGPTTITVDLSQASANFPLGGGVNNALDQIISEINAQITAAGVPAGLAAVATRNSNGQLVIESRGNVTYDASSFAGSIGKTAFAALGLQERTYKTEDPYFDIQVGTGSTVRIKIEPGDDVTDLIDKLEYNPLTGQGVPGLNVAYDTATGRLTLRPGIDDSNGGPDFGGDIKIIAGPGKTTGAINATLAALPQGVSIAGALFGSYSVSGSTVSEFSAVTNVRYGSETFAGSGVFVDFRRDYLGPEANLKTQITTGASVVDFGQKIVNSHAQDIILNDAQVSDQSTLRDLLQERFLNETSVNIDEELSTLIVIQTAYSAAARAVSAANEMFDELLAAFR